LRVFIAARAVGSVASGFPRFVVADTTVFGGQPASELSRVIIAEMTVLFVSSEWIQVVIADVANFGG
jgi:hypothetical protein